jgi:hypothetical protein
VTLLGGTSAFGILNAVILQNAHHMQNWYIELKLSEFAIPAASISLVLAAVFTAAQVFPATRGTALTAARLFKLATGSMVLILMILDAFTGEPWLDIPAGAFQLVVPFAWLIMIPPTATAENLPIAKAFTGLVASTLVLYAFPVAGGQVALASLLPVVTIPLLIVDSINSQETDRYPITGLILSRFFVAPSNSCDCRCIGDHMLPFIRADISSI